MTEKTCTKCGKTKPLDGFHRRRSGSEKRRAACKVCAAKAAEYRKTNPPLISQIIRHHMDPTAPLSPEAEASIYPDKPLDPVLVERFRKRQRDEANRLRRLRREAERNPMSHAARCYARMTRE